LAFLATPLRSEVATGWWTTAGHN